MSTPNAGSNGAGAYLSEQGRDCEVCERTPQSPNRILGVAAVPGAPVSLVWCAECLANGALPIFIIDVWLFQEFTEDVYKPIPNEPPPLDDLSDWFLESSVYMNDRYQKVRNVLPRIWAEGKVAVEENRHK